MRFNLTILFFVLVASISFPQIEDNAEKDFGKFFEVGGDVLTAPKDFNSDDWIKLSASIGVTGLALLFDNDIKEFSQSNKTDFLNTVFKIDDYYHSELMAASIVVLYGYALIDKNNEVRNLSLRLAEATVYGSLINMSLKFVGGRSRPFYAQNPFEFDPFKTNFEQTSFPSGHSTLAFAFSSVMAKEYKNFFWKFGWYTIAGLTAYARVYNNEHWFSDIIFGSAIGLFVGEFVNSHSTNQKAELINQPILPPPSIISFSIPF
ncbi:MAG: phosphatase PAP2 family protein [Ignavibacteriaceae bacterium]